MNILITGSSSGVGNGLAKILSIANNVIGLTRNDLDLSNIKNVSIFELPVIDMLINCAGTDIGGKIEFTNHNTDEIVKILNTNLVSPVILSQKALKNNVNCKIVNITSTNNNRYYANNLAYSLSKKALESFTNMLQVEYPKANILEVRLGLTKTNFNKNRFKGHEDRFNDIYVNKHLTIDEAVSQITSVLFNDSIKFIEVAP